MRFRSRSPIDARRPGFTLPEVLMASAIAAVVIGLVINAYIGANKALNATVGGNQLKMAGEKGLEGIYRSLKSCKKIFDNDGPSGTTIKWLERTDIAPWPDSGGLEPAVQVADLQLPT